MRFLILRHTTWARKIGNRGHDRRILRSCSLRPLKAALNAYANDWKLTGRKQRLSLLINW